MDRPPGASQAPGVSHGLDIRLVTLVGDWQTSGLRMVVIGLGAAFIGFLVGRLFQTAGP